MAKDIYIKFGESGEKDDKGKPFPEIEGDSSDEEHYWWTEVRDCNFSIKAAEQPPENDDDTGDSAAPHEEPRPTLNPVKIGKKVDWGSADLFRLCCQSPIDLKTNKGIDPKEDKGQLDSVIVEVCRRSGIEKEGRYAFLTITFGGVYIVGYQIDFSGPDPIEEITLKYGRLSYTYISSHPDTGGQMDTYNARNMNGFPVQQNSATSAAPAASTAAAAGSSAGGGGVAVPVVAVPTGASGGGGGSSAAGPAPDAAVAVNYPGYMSVAGNGLLPD